MGRINSPEVAVSRSTLDKIHETYSADLITGSPSKIRSPLTFEGELWVCVGYGPGELAHAYRLLPIAQWNEQTHNGPTLKYPTYEECEARRSDPFGFYHTTLVRCKGQQFVMVGPEYSFVPETESPSVSAPIETVNPQLSLF